jgi:hypothetical protein
VNNPPLKQYTPRKGQLDPNHEEKIAEEANAHRKNEGPHPILRFHEPAGKNHEQESGNEKTDPLHQKNV